MFAGTGSTVLGIALWVFSVYLLLRFSPRLVALVRRWIAHG